MMNGAFAGITFPSGAPLFLFLKSCSVNFVFSATKWCVAQPTEVGCLRGLGATTNKLSKASCLDTDIACQFVKKPIN